MQQRNTMLLYEQNKMNGMQNRMFKNRVHNSVCHQADQTAIAAKQVGLARRWRLAETTNGRREMRLRSLWILCLQFGWRKT